MTPPHLHKHDQAERHAALGRAAVLDAVMCSMGLILFIQTKSMIWLFAGVALGTAIFFAALVKYVRSGRKSPQGLGKPKTIKQPPPAHPAGSNVTPFRRPNTKKPPNNSNRTSA